MVQLFKLSGHLLESLTAQLLSYVGNSEGSQA